MNEEWKKEMNETDKEKLLDLGYRVTTLERNYIEIKSDVKDVKDLLIKVDKRLSVVPEGGLQCPIHQERLNMMTARLDVIEKITNGIYKKSLIWTGVFTVLVFLAGNLLLPYITGNYKVTSNSSTHEHTVMVGTNAVTIK